MKQTRCKRYIFIFIWKFQKRQIYGDIKLASGCLELGKGASLKRALRSLLEWWKCCKTKWWWWWLCSCVSLLKDRWVVYLSWLNFMVIYNSLKLSEKKKAFVKAQQAPWPSRGWRPHEEGGWVWWPLSGYENLVVHTGIEQIRTYTKGQGGWFSGYLRKGENKNEHSYIRLVLEVSV